MSKKSIVWFRRDLRIYDNRALYCASGEILPIFIFDKNILKDLEKDDRRVTYIFDTILKLKENLQNIGLDLLIFFANPADVFRYLVKFGFEKVYLSVDNQSYSLNRDIEIEKIIKVVRFNDSFLFDSGEILNKEGLPYRVFTSYYKKSLEILNESHYEEIIDEPKSLSSFDFSNIIELESSLINKEISLDSINFKRAELPKFATIKPEIAFFNFLKKIESYKERRDFLDEEATSKIGLFLRFGTISIRWIIRELKRAQNEGIEIQSYYRELIWREFYNQILSNFSYTQNSNFNNLTIEWENRDEDIYAIFNSKSGIPIVDAAVNELKNSGYMHNRARMIFASFFCKNLLCDWKIGERFFAKYLLDYEECNNIGSWQWCAGCGVDAQLFFRIFNPYLQTKKFSLNCEYIYKNLVVLKDVPKSILSDEKRLFSQNFKDYPKPIVDIKSSTTRAKSRVFYAKR